MRLSISCVKSDNFRAWKKYSGSDGIAKDALEKMRTVDPVHRLAGNRIMLVWARSFATVSGYKVIKVIIIELCFGINCVKSDYFLIKTA